MRGLGPPQKRQLLWGKGAAADQVKPYFLQKNTANQKARRDVVRVFLQGLAANTVKSRV